MSTPSQPDDDETPGGRTRTAGSDAGSPASNGGGSDPEATVVGHGPAGGAEGTGGPMMASGAGDPRGGDQRPGDQRPGDQRSGDQRPGDQRPGPGAGSPGGGSAAPGSGPSTGSTPAAGGAATPPPWARRGAAGNAAPGPGAGRPSGPPGGPSTGSTPAAAGTGAAAARTGGPASGTAAGGPGTGPRGEGPGRGTGTGRGGGNTALIDAPTNQLSPEQLGMRRSGRGPTDANGPQDDEAAEAAPASRSGKSKTPRRASLQVKRFDPWSVLKLALVLGVALFFVWMFAVGVLYAVLDGMGVWAQLNGTYQDLTSDSGGGGQLITAGGVFGVAAIVGVINTILFTALASVSAFIYNISADVAGGIEVTLSERD